MCHGYHCKLGIGFVHVGDKSDASRVENSDPLDFSPFGEMTGYSLLNIVCNMYSSDIYGEILTHEGAHTTHVVSVISMLVTAETVYIRTVHIVDGRQTMKIG